MALAMATATSILPHSHTYLRNSSRSPDCAMETSVLVMDVPTLTPMIMGTDALTVRTVETLLQQLPAPAACPPPPPSWGGGDRLTLRGHHADDNGG